MKLLIDDIDDAGYGYAGGFLFTCVRAGATRRAATKIAFILLPNNCCLPIDGHQNQLLPNYGTHHQLNQVDSR